MFPSLLKVSFASIPVLMLVAFVVPSSGQQPAQAGAVAREPGASPTPTDSDTLPDSPLVVTSIAYTFRITPIKGLSRPFALAFLPDGSMLVTERAGRLRIVRNGVLDRLRACRNCWICD